MNTSFVFDPLVPPIIMLTLGALVFIGALLSARISIGAALARLFALGVIVLALLNPQKLIENRQALDDVALVITDRSASMDIPERTEIAEQTRNQLLESLGALPELQVNETVIRSSEAGTLFTQALVEGLGAIPPDRLSGVFVITDGQVHDLPETLDGLVPDNIPVHALITGRDDARDRRINPVISPRYGVVGEQVVFEATIEDPGFEGQTVVVSLRVDGLDRRTILADIGETIRIPVEIENRGDNIVEMIVEAAPDELTLNNNIYTSVVSGIRDRLRVLLVTGEPHAGGRSWRNLLKSDPSVDVVQFTILRPTNKIVSADQNELSLIAFPSRQLFEEKLDEFDLIIFDQYERRSPAILPPVYFYNIATYVENGGALLVATGPAFVTDASLYRSSLNAVLPIQPDDSTLDTAFRPALSDKGERHPITSDFADQDETWGRWYRLARSDAISGDILMEGPEGNPLLVIDNVIDGRAAVLLSDQAWLWSKNHDGGGPYNEMFRRLAHWLMQEPDLEAETLELEQGEETFKIIRNSLGEIVDDVMVERPDGTMESVSLTEISPGRFMAEIQAGEPGPYRLRSGDVQAVAAVGTFNPVETEDLLPTPNVLQPLTVFTSGGMYRVTQDGAALPDIRKVGLDRPASDASWAGVRANGRYTVTQSSRDPLISGLLLFILAALAMGLVWWREGR